MTAIPSMPTFSSMTLLMPLAKQSSFSESLIWREASEMSVSPSQNSLKPSPVPGPSTVTDTSGATSSNNSATRIEIGSTVDEPEMFTSPETVEGSTAGSAISSSVMAATVVVGAASAAPVSAVATDGVEVSSSSPPHAAATSEKLAMITGSQRSRRLELRT